MIENRLNNVVYAKINIKQDKNIFLSHIYEKYDTFALIQKLMTYKI